MTEPFSLSFNESLTRDTLETRICFNYIKNDAFSPAGCAIQSLAGYKIFCLCVHVSNNHNSACKLSLRNV